MRKALAVLAVEVLVGIALFRVSPMLTYALVGNALGNIVGVACFKLFVKR